MFFTLAQFQLVTQTHLRLYFLNHISFTKNYITEKECSESKFVMYLKLKHHGKSKNNTRKSKISFIPRNLLLL
jgi:hypothetical protein